MRMRGGGTNGGVSSLRKKSGSPLRKAFDAAELFIW